MKRVFINFTNHVSELWSEKQKAAAERYGSIVDVPFPNVSPQCDREHIGRMAEEIIQELSSMNPAAVLCQGEFCLAYQVIKGLQEKGIKVLAACSERNTIETGNQKRVTFEFVQYREF